MDKITVIIFSYNNEKIINSCIKSAKLLSNNIILIDQESNDQTIFLAKKMLINVFKFPHCNWVEPARQFGIDKSITDWVFILDADERITPALAQEIRSRLNRDEIRNFTHYQIPRKNIFIDRWLKYGGWWPDYQVRLINKKSLKNWPKEIHSTPQIEGQGSIFKQPLLHYFHGNVESMVKKTIIFEDVESELLFKAGWLVNSFIFFRKFFGELYRRLVRSLGFLDGTVGIIESIYQAFSKTITYLFLYEKNKNRRPV